MHTKPATTFIRLDTFYQAAKISVNPPSRGELDGIKSKNNGDGSSQIQCRHENKAVRYAFIADDSSVFPENITMN